MRINRRYHFFSLGGGLPRGWCWRLDLQERFVWKMESKFHRSRHGFQGGVLHEALFQAAWIVVMRWVNLRVIVVYLSCSEWSSCRKWCGGVTRVRTQDGDAHGKRSENERSKHSQDSFFIQDRTIVLGNTVPPIRQTLLQLNSIPDRSTCTQKYAVWVSCISNPGHWNVWTKG